MFKSKISTGVIYSRTDTEKELQLVKEAALKSGAYDAVVARHWADGSKGAEELAEAVIKACDQPSEFKFLYDLGLSLKEKINVVAKEMYGAGSVEFAPKVKDALDRYTKQVRIFHYQNKLVNIVT